MSGPGPGRNRLAGEASPYLAQHADDPVDWYPWGEEAFARARELDRPVLLSIGYAACHWCHVMQRESFRDERIAALLSESFVAVKVDREERPDVDALYVRAVESMTGSAGWPLTVFLTPDREPFHGGTYFPPYALGGRPGFHDLLVGIAHAWGRDARRWREWAWDPTRRLAAEASRAATGRVPDDALDRSAEALRGLFDPVHGGFGGAPKFPRAVDLRLVLRHAARTGEDVDRVVAARSLRAMARGGIHDQLAGGFHRYAVDEAWRVPHFEKMLHDSALLVPTFLEASLLLGAPELAAVARDACRWMRREMRLPGGGFAASLDADSAGGEGAFYTWTPDELAAVLGAERAHRAQEWFDVGDDGDLADGRSVLARPEEDATVAARVGMPVDALAREMSAARDALFAARGRRARPARDDKVLAGWNGLAVSALAHGYQVLGDAEDLAAARSAARFVLAAMRRPDGRLLASACDGRARHPATLDDHAYVVQALVDLHESDFDPAWLRAALELTEVVERDFRPDADGPYHLAGADVDDLVAPLVPRRDGALPSGNGVHALNLLRLAELTGRRDLAARAERLLLALAQDVTRAAAHTSSLLLAVDFLRAPPREVVVAGHADDARTRALLETVRSTYRPQRVVTGAHPGADVELVPLLEGRLGEAPPAVHVCTGWTCASPSTTPDAVRAALLGSE